MLPHGWGVRPSLESPAVSSYIIAEPCWAHPGCFVRLPLNVIVAKIKRRVRSHSLVGWAWVRRGLPTWSPAETTEQTQSEVFGKRFHVAQREAYPLYLTPRTVCSGSGAPLLAHLPFCASPEHKTRVGMPLAELRQRAESAKLSKWHKPNAFTFIYFFSLPLTVAATICRY